jgi:hypothetical protein
MSAAFFRAMSTAGQMAANRQKRNEAMGGEYREKNVNRGNITPETAK